MFSTAAGRREALPLVSPELVVGLLESRVDNGKRRRGRIC